MGQVTIYLDEATEKKMIKLARKKGQSKSRWISELIQKEADRNWPASVIELVGAWKDFPSIGEIRKKIGRDSGRDSL